MDHDSCAYLGGIPRILIPDNTKTAVIHNNDWYTPQLNQTHHEMTEHYNTAILPARIRAPKDKPNAEGSVGIISTWITAALRKVLSKYANPVVLIISEYPLSAVKILTVPACNFKNRLNLSYFRV